MTGHLFSSWISHFVKSLDSRGGISHTNTHFLVMDGHGSHVTFGSGLQGYANWIGLGDFAFSYLTQVAATGCECVSTFQMCFSRLQGRMDIAP